MIVVGKNTEGKYWEGDNTRGDDEHYRGLLRKATGIY